VSLETGLSKISKHRIVPEKNWEKSTIVMLPPIAGVSLFEVSVKLDVGFLRHNMRERESDISAQLMIVLLSEHQQMPSQNFLYSL
jgi:hypothetical protein